MTLRASLHVSWILSSGAFVGSANACQRSVSHWLSLLLSIGAVPGVLFSTSLLHPHPASSVTACRRCNQQTVRSCHPSDDPGSFRAAAIACRDAERANSLG